MKRLGEIFTRPDSIERDQMWNYNCCRRAIRSQNAGDKLWLKQFEQRCRSELRIRLRELLETVKEDTRTRRRREEKQNAPATTTATRRSGPWLTRLAGKHRSEANERGKGAIIEQEEALLEDDDIETESVETPRLAKTPEDRAIAHHEPSIAVEAGRILVAGHSSTHDPLEASVIAGMASNNNQEINGEITSQHIAR